jgi:hypothetical protein
MDVCINSRVYVPTGGGGGGTITHVQSGGTPTDNSASASRATASNVTSGNLLVIQVTSFKSSNDPFVVGDISQSAGTATLGSFSLDVQRNYNYTGSSYLNTAIFSAIVSGSGSCTITVGGAPADSYWNLVVGEFSSSTGWDSSRLEDSDYGEGASGAPATGDGTCASSGLFIGGVSLAGETSITITEDSAFSLMDEEENGTLHMTGSGIYRIVSSGTTDAASWTAPTTEEWSAVLAVYKTV